MPIRWRYQCLLRNVPLLPARCPWEWESVWSLAEIQVSLTRQSGPLLWISCFDNSLLTKCQRFRDGSSQAVDSRFQPLIWAAGRGAVTWHRSGKRAGRGRGAAAQSSLRFREAGQRARPSTQSFLNTAHDHPSDFLFLKQII